jgi:hypothetical protein
MRWSLTDLFVLILLACLGLAVYRAFWGTPYFNARIVLGGNLVLLAVATAGVWYGNSRLRRMYLAYAIFGWSYLVVVLHGGFGFDLDAYSNSLTRHSIVGILMGLICASIAHLVIRGGTGVKAKDTSPGSGDGKD